MLANGFQRSIHAESLDKPTPAGGTGYFDTQADRWIGLYGSRRGFQQRLELFTQSLQECAPPPGPVLDFGCGPGVLSLTLASRGYEVLGVDGAPRMIEMARRERDRRGCPRANFEVMDAHSFELSRKFAAVVCSSVIEYVPDDMKLLRDLSSVLVPGGHLVISVPNAGSIFGVVEDCLSKVPAYRQSVGRRHLEFSLRRYTRKRFSRALESIGIRPRTHTYFEAPLPGGSGAALARLPAVGVMLLVVGQKVA